MMTRKPIVSGQFYERDPERLKQQIEESFLSEFGPGFIPKKEKNKNILVAICPHAGYVFSGPGAAHCYKEIAESHPPNTFILLGLSHQGQNSCLSLEDWETPLGIVKTDKEFQETLIKNSTLKQDEAAHQNEHSIEVQLPFLQFINPEKEFKIAPIIVSEDLDHKEIANSIYQTIKELNRKVIIIASSDFTHYGMNYRYVPFQEDIKENIYNLDKKAIEHIKKLDSDQFLNYITDTGATICGKNPIVVGIELSKMLGAKEAKLLKYYTSGDIMNDYSSAVGYGSIIIY